jgi:hypothetical protein
MQNHHTKLTQNKARTIDHESAEKALIESISLRSLFDMHMAGTAVVGGCLEGMFAFFVRG